MLRRTIGRTLGLFAVGVRAASSEAPSLPIMAPQAIMLPRAHGTCVAPVQEELRWGADRAKADHICCFNRHYAEEHGYWEQTPLLREMHSNWPEPTTFYDSVTGKALFVAPVDRTVEEFARESSAHGWPSFRDAEVVRCASAASPIFASVGRLTPRPSTLPSHACCASHSTLGLGERARRWAGSAGRNGER